MHQIPVRWDSLPECFLLALLADALNFRYRCLFYRKHLDTYGNVAVLDKDEQAVYDILSWDVPVTMDEIIIRLHGNVSNVSFLLVRMQIEGLIKEDSTHGFLRASKEGVL